MSNGLAAYIEKDFEGKNLIIVSNREPYVHKKAGEGFRIEQPAGGLTSAMDDVLKATGGIWTAWGSGSGDRDVVDENRRIMVPPEKPAYTLKRVWLSHSEVENYYHGYSNQVLWPLCHMSLDRVYFRKRFWEEYKKANHAFATAVLEEADEQSIVWVHDYHLCLVPEILREKKRELTIAYFWHIPWPDWSVFRICPQSKEILEAMLSNDLIGFQIPLFARNFMDCVRESILNAETNYRKSTITYNGHTTRLKAFPIRIDFDRFNSLSSSWKNSRAIKKLKKKYHLTGQVGVGVDRLEYTKALLKRLQAINLFFDRYERFRGKVTFIQIAVPTRLKEPYLAYQRSVETLVQRINDRFSSGAWKPIIYIDTKVEHKDLAAYYRMADVGIVSSAYDGMNLVGKEYVACQTDENGVLILSEFAGAADELDGAILVNPYDIEGFSDSIKNALTMSPQERTERMKVLRTQIRENDIYKWISDMLREMIFISSSKQQQGCYFFDYTDTVQDSLAGRRTGKSPQVRSPYFLFLDYDGTLTPIAESPDKARIADEMRSLILELKKQVPVAIISGRGLENIKEQIGIEDVIYAGNHGSEIWDGERIVVSQQNAGTVQLLQEFLEKLGEATAHIPGVLIEDKGVTASVHFRQVKTKALAELFELFTKIASAYEKSFRITSGKKVFEIRPFDAWNKGDAVTWIMERMGNGRLPMYIGDDTTDEDAFRAIKEKGISISIGGSPEADYFLKNQDEVNNFLQWLIERQQ